MRRRALSGAFIGCYHCFKQELLLLLFIFTFSCRILLFTVSDRASQFPLKLFITHYLGRQCYQVSRELEGEVLRSVLEVPSSLPLVLLPAR